MFTNNCSTAFITTRNGQRAAKWLRLFGVDALPVKHERPRWQATANRDDVMLAYDLDATRLNEWQIARFAGYIAARTGTPFTAAKKLVDGWPLEAAGCEAVSEDVLSRQRGGHRQLIPLPIHLLPKLPQFA